MFKNRIIKYCIHLLKAKVALHVSRHSLKFVGRNHLSKFSENMIAALEKKVRSWSKYSA